MTLEPGGPVRRPASEDRLLELRLVRPPQVIAREVGEWLMLIDVDTGFTYEANWLGAQVWRLLADGQSVGEACGALARVHSDAREAIESDVLAFVRDLLSYGLVSAAAGPVPGRVLPATIEP
jgi:hypothetical protein